MQRIASLDTVALPSQPVASAVVSEIIQPRTKWTPAALLVATFAGIAAPSFALYTRTRMEVYTGGPSDGLDGFVGIANGVNYAFGNGGGVAMTRAAGDSRARNIDLSGNAIIPASFDESLPSQAEGWVSEVLLPARPAYTLLGLLNAIDSAIDPADDFVVLVDQLGERVWAASVSGIGSGESSGIFLLVQGILEGEFSLVAAYNLADVPAGGTPGVIPVWE